MGFFLTSYCLMISFRSATIITAIYCFSATNVAAETLSARLEQAARAQLDRQAAAAGLVEPRFEVALATTRPAPPCAQPVAIEPLDTRLAARMRFVVRCPDAGGWRYEYLLRARVTAMVAVTATAVAANEPLSPDAVTLERRDVSAIADPVSAEQAIGQSSRRMLRAGEVLRAGQLAAPVLVKRGDQVVMVARQQQIEVSTSGEALDAGSRGAIVRVRNGASGQVVRMRVTGAGTVEPVDLALTR
jgi:flagella basal body P-ring formation protein FlgA